MGIESDHSALAELTNAVRASAMGTMAATLAHELNQPLTVISNYAAICGQLIDRDVQDTAELKLAVAGIRDGVHRMARIICSLRDMSEERAPNLEVFDLKDAIRESIELVQAGTGCGLPINDGDALSVELVADRIQIEQVIMNLVRNACEATVSAVGGQVSVSACVKGQDAIVSVQDNGSGVSAKAAATLFERGCSIKLQGMGIGLSICRTIIEEHGGKIWLETSSSGANFCFSVPLAPKI